LPKQKHPSLWYCAIARRSPGGVQIVGTKIRQGFHAMKHLELISITALALGIAMAGSPTATRPANWSRPLDKRCRLHCRLRIKQRTHHPLGDARSGMGLRSGHRRGYCQREIALHRCRRPGTRQVCRRQDDRAALLGTHRLYRLSGQRRAHGLVRRSHSVDSTDDARHRGTVKPAKASSVTG
jgi:hypothetical protein